jgi:hypothetical protein
MKKLTDMLISIAVIGGILILSAVFTSWFTRRMYLQCSECRTLNARRRAHCRNCGRELERPPEK